MSDEELSTLVGLVDGSVVIGFKDAEASAGVDARGRRLASDSATLAGEAFLLAESSQVLHRYDFIPVIHARIDPERVAQIRAHPLVDYIEPDLPKYRILSAPVGTRPGRTAAAPRSAQSTEDTTWAIERIQAPDVWSQATGANTSVAILDTGIYSDHPDLAPFATAACDGSSGEDPQGHGTEVAGLIAALSNGVGVIGAAYDARILSVRLGGLGSFGPADVLCGIEWARNSSKNPRVVNMSFGDSSGVGEASVMDQITNAWTDGILMVAAAGDGSAPWVQFPANMSEVIAVIGTDRHDVRDPDCDIRTLEPASSYAAALVSGAATLLFSHDPSWTNADVRNRLRASALDLGPSGKDTQYGYGLVQALDALNYQMPDPPEVAIDGPLEIDPEATCTWDAVVTDGHAPLSYEWRVNGLSVGTDDHWTGGNPGGNTNSYFELKVTVSDYLGRQDQASITVQLSSSAPLCTI